MCVFRPSRFQRRNSLASQADRHHHELPVEPRVLEPEEQRDAEDDGKRAEAQKRTCGGASTTKDCRSRRQRGAAQGSAAPRDTPRASSSPNKEAARPVRTPASSAAGAAPLRSVTCLPAPQDPEQQRAPRQQHHRGANDGGTHDGPLLQQRELAQHQQADDERGVHEKRAAGRQPGAENGSRCGRTRGYLHCAAGFGHRSP